MTVTIQGLDKLTLKLERLEKFHLRMKPAVEASLTILHNDIGKTPTKAEGAFSALASPAQKRAYWARVGSGQINHREGIGYVRSGVSQQGWRERVQLTSSGVKGTLENPVKHAQMLFGDRQQAFHKRSGWRTAKQVTEDGRSGVVREFERAANREINR